MAIGIHNWRTVASNRLGFRCSGIIGEQAEHLPFDFTPGARQPPYVHVQVSSKEGHAQY
jgi:hypothetical protein